MQKARQSLSTVKARIQDKEDPNAGPDPVIEAAKDLPRIDMCQCTGTQERQETVRRSAKQVVKDVGTRKNPKKMVKEKEYDKVYTAYVFRVTDEHKQSWQVEKRFSEIRQFKKDLVKSGADIVKGWELPAKANVKAVKKSSRKMNEAVIAERKQQLETFMSLSVSFFGKHPIVKYFLANDADRTRLAEHAVDGLTMDGEPDGQPMGGFPPAAGAPAPPGAADAAGTSSPGEGLFQSAQLRSSAAEEESQLELALALSRSESDGAGAQPSMAERALAAGQGNEEDVVRTLLKQSEEEDAARKLLEQREAEQVQQALRASTGLEQPLFFEQQPGRSYDDDEDERPLNRSKPTGLSGNPAGRQARVTEDAPATSAAALAVRQGDVVEVVSVASAHWWTVRLGADQGFVSPKVLQVLPEGPTADARNFLLMVSPNQIVSIGRKLKLSAVDMQSLIQGVCEELNLAGSFVVAPAVPSGTEPAPYPSFADVPEKGKVQVWPAEMFAPAPAPGPGPGSGSGSGPG